MAKLPVPGTNPVVESAEVEVGHCMSPSRPLLNFWALYIGTSNSLN